MSSRSSLLSLAAALLVTTVAACGGSSASSAQASAANEVRDMNAIDSRLRGAWRLVDYRPELAPDPMFQALLIAQIGSMIVRFESGHLYADSPTFHVVRPYRIVKAAGPLFTLESQDIGAAVLTTRATISDDGQRITFQGDTAPWRGSGALVRAQ